MKVVYHTPEDAVEFNFEKFYESLNNYEKIGRNELEEALTALKDRDLVHVSVLVELGVKLIKEEGNARKFYDDHYDANQNFERLRRITGYLVGTLSRWNDAKQAEEHDRVKHGVACTYSAENKAYIEAEKAKLAGSEQNEYHKGM